MNPEISPKGLPSGQPTQIAEFVSYQEGSVVSREIIKKATGSVTIFAFDQDQGLSEHTAPFDALVQVVEGETEIIIADNHTACKAGKPFSCQHVSHTPSRRLPGSR